MSNKRGLVLLMYVPNQTLKRVKSLKDRPCAPQAIVQPGSESTGCGTGVDGSHAIAFQPLTCRRILCISEDQR